MRLDDVHKCECPFHYSRTPAPRVHTFVARAVREWGRAAEPSNEVAPGAEGPPGLDPRRRVVRPLRPGALARFDQLLQLRRPDLRRLGGVLRAAVGLPVLPAAVLDPGPGDVAREPPRGGGDVPDAGVPDAHRLPVRAARRAAEDAPAPWRRRRGGARVGGARLLQRHQLRRQLRVAASRSRAATCATSCSRSSCCSRPASC